MNGGQVFFVFLSLQLGDSSAEEEVNHFYKVPGEDVTVRCSSDSPGTWKIFCRENCEGENLLIETNQETYQTGRYRTEYSRGSWSSPGLSVSISDVTQSDSGLYRCGLGRSSSSASYRGFQLFVADALLDENKVHHIYKTSGSSLTVRCSFRFSGWRKSFCRGECEGDKILLQTEGDRAEAGRYRIKYEGGYLSSFIYVSMEQLTSSDSGRYRCYLDRTVVSDGYEEFRVTVTDALLEGDKVHLVSKAAGSSLTVGCVFKKSGKSGSFCRGECVEDLVQTDGDRADRDRYRIEYEGGVLLVTINQLTRSDSGRYRCYQDRTRSSVREFEVLVTGVEPSASSSSTTSSSSASSSSTTTQSSPSVSSETSDQNTGTPGGTPGALHSSARVLLLVALILVFIIVLFCVVLLVFFRKRSAKLQKNRPEQTGNAAAAETNRIYEDIGEEDGQRGPPVETHTAYSYITCSQPTGAQTDDDYSFVTAAAPPLTAQDASSKVDYAEVQFSNRSSGSPLRGSTDVLYSVARLDGGSRAVDEPLYSNVT